MDPYNHNMPPAPTPSSRAEADRWLAIAEKLLANRDLVGSKTFAIRARESDPRLESADQILALADTLIASDKHIILNKPNHNNNNNTTSLPDWYSVLQLPPLTSDSDLIAAHYRGLAILLNPNRSRLPFAHQAFQIVSDAWSVLSNPQQKSVYDRQIAAVQHNNNNNNISNSGSGFDANVGGNVGDNGNNNNNNNHQGSNSRVYETNPREDANASGWAAGPGGNDGDNGNNARNVDGDDRGNEVGETFWTACPYCYNMYEYPKAYEECTMRCQNCRRAFHGAKIPAPPLQEREREGEGEGETTYATWGFYPLGVSMSMMEMNKGGVANWTPFSPMFSCPSVKVEVAEEKKKKSRMTEPVVYIEDEDEDDDDVFFDDFESSEGSDDEWGSTRKKTKKRRSGRRGRGKKTAGRSVRATAVDDVAKEGGGVVGKKQVGKAMKERGKLDLNVEFNNNEVEENANGAVRGGARTENGEEDGEIEGIGFFEGLDEFLSSLPILNAVGDDKVKAA